MGKVSIGLRGWRFEESEVFDETGALRPIDEMDDEVATQIARLSVLVTSPCDACWLLHGEDDLAKCNVPAAVYGEPLFEVLVCADHETDFVYWYREASGKAYRGTEELQDAFHEWFDDGGRAPPGYDGIEHVDTAPEDVRTLDAANVSEADVDLTREYPG